MHVRSVPEKIIEQNHVTMILQFHGLGPTQICISHILFREDGGHRMTHALQFYAQDKVYLRRNPSLGYQRDCWWKVAGIGAIHHYFSCGTSSNLREEAVYVCGFRR